ncbi:MAG TPA: preprotein translocase subunit YajC [Prolixibacteraceae bacterium]|nr:preprotein translocase subunit YajC [Prolixibacteraceae bacterium]
MNYLLMAPPAGAETSPWATFLPFLVILLIFYFFMIRPQVKRQKELKTFRESLAKGDKVVTTGGIYGKVVEIKDNYVIMQVDDNVNIKVDKAAIIKDMSDAVQQR